MSKFTVLALAACALLLGGCSVFSGLSTVKECNYTFAGLDNFSYAGVKLDKLKDGSALRYSVSSLKATSGINGKPQSRTLSGLTCL